MTYGQRQEMILAIGDELQELANDEVLCDHIRRYADAVREANKNKKLVRIEFNMIIMQFMLALMKDHAKAMEKIICHTQGISKEQLLEMDEEKTLGAFAETFNTVLKPFFSLCAAMGF